jgi:hypothetical protein
MEGRSNRAIELQSLMGYAGSVLVDRGDRDRKESLW